MAWIPLLMKLAPMLGGIMGKGGGAAAGGGGGMGVSGMGPTAQTSGFMPNGQMVPQAWDPKTGQLGPVQQGPVGGPNPGAAQTGGGGGGGAQQSMSGQQLHDNITRNVNGFFNGLQMFGHSLGGLDKTPLNNITRNPAQIIHPADNQNPGVVGLAALMTKIIGGGGQ